MPPTGNQLKEVLVTYHENFSGDTYGITTGNVYYSTSIIQERGPGIWITRRSVNPNHENLGS